MEYMVAINTESNKLGEFDYHDGAKWRSLIPRLGADKIEAIISKNSKRWTNIENLSKQKESIFEDSRSLINLVSGLDKHFRRSGIYNYQEKLAVIKSLGLTDLLRPNQVPKNHTIESIKQDDKIEKGLILWAQHMGEQERAKTIKTRFVRGGIILTSVVAALVAGRNFLGRGSESVDIQKQSYSQADKLPTQTADIVTSTLVPEVALPEPTSTHEPESIDVAEGLSPKEKMRHDWDSIVHDYFPMAHGIRFPSFVLPEDVNDYAAFEQSAHKFILEHDLLQGGDSLELDFSSDGNIYVTVEKLPDGSIMAHHWIAKGSTYQNWPNQPHFFEFSDGVCRAFDSDTDTMEVPNSWNGGIVNIAEGDPNYCIAVIDVAGGPKMLYEYDISSGQVIVRLAYVR